MLSRTKLLSSIAETIQDYRHGEIPAPTPAHVERWVNQFSPAIQNALLLELDHVLKSTYIDRANVLSFLSTVLTNPKIAGTDPSKFWQGVHFLNIQGGGNSQREMLGIFESQFLKTYGFSIANCGKDGTTFIYLDDVIFTGNRVLHDLSSWIQNEAPVRANVHIITIAFHRGGQNYATKKIVDAARNAGKQISITWWRGVEIEDSKPNINTSDVLRPTHLPNDGRVAAYAAGLRYQVAYRRAGSIGENKFFSSEEGRDVLEQELLKAGAQIREMCPLLNKYLRPLGNMVLETLGFGSTFVTFRNCPNNAPLAFWAGYPWYPLFPRKTN